METMSRRTAEHRLEKEFGPLVHHLKEVRRAMSQAVATRRACLRLVRPRDQAGLVGQDDRLHAVSQAELH